jgi:type VI secretion system protein VasJ
MRGLEERVRRELDAIPAPAAPTPVFAPPPPLPTALAPTTTEALPDRADQVPAFVRRASGQLVAAAALVRASALLDPEALRTTLVALYLPIACAPETTRDARTSLPAPSKLVLETLTKQQTSMAPEMLVRDALAALERSRFALDLHVIVARALERGGAARACAIHRHEVTGLFARLPELLDREFADGTRFASAETRAFFTVAPATTETPATEDPLEPVRALSRAGRIADALALGSDLRRRASSGRARFEATLAMSALAEEARALPLASELHAELLGTMDAHTLDAWEPALAAAVLRASARLAPAGSETSRTAFARLCRIDARAAFEISSSVHTTPGKTGR